MSNHAVQPRPVSYRWLIFGLIAFAYLLVYFHRLSTAVVASDMMRDLEAGGGLIGLLASAYFYPYALMQIPSGLLTDSWGPRRMITISFILAGAASIGFGLASSALWAIIARVFVGLGVSLLFVPAMKILTQWFRKKEFAMMTGLLMAVGGLGALTAAAPLAYMSLALGWRGSFISIGIVTLAVAAAIWFLVRNKPQDLGYPPVEATGIGGPTETIPLGRGLKMVLSRRSFWPLALWFFFTCGVFFSLGGLWGGPYLEHVYHMPKTQTGKVLSMIAVGMIIGSPLLSFISDRIRSRKKILIASTLLLLALTAVPVLAPAGMNTIMLYAFFFLISLSSSAIVVIAFTASKELFPVAIAGTAVGAVNFFPFLGGAVMQPLIGLALDYQGMVDGVYTPEAYSKAFLILMGSAAIALVCSFLVEETIDGRGD